MTSCIPYPVEHLPPLRTQLADWHQSLAQWGPEPLAARQTQIQCEARGAPPPPRYGRVCNLPMPQQVGTSGCPKAVLEYLAAHPGRHDLSAIAHVCSAWQRKAVGSALNALVAAGRVRRIRTRESGLYSLYELMGDGK